MSTYWIFSPMPSGWPSPERMLITFNENSLRWMSDYALLTFFDNPIILVMN